MKRPQWLQALAAQAIVVQSRPFVAVLTPRLTVGRRVLLLAEYLAHSGWPLYRLANPNGLRICQVDSHNGWRLCEY